MDDLPPRTATTAGAAALAVVLAVLVAVALWAGGEDPAAAAGHDHSTAAEDAAGTAGGGAVGVAAGLPERHIGPQGRVGQFVAECTYSHTAPDDPIVHFGHPGRSHSHDFYGAVGVDAFSTAEALLGAETTCDKMADRASYWQPTLYDGGEPVRPRKAVAYYRAAPGVEPTAVEPYPLGLEMIAGDATAEGPQPGEAAGWVCGVSTRLSDEPPDCPSSAPLHMLLTFPDCWDGRNLSSADHASHVAYSSGGECPRGHPVHVPQLTVSIAFPITGPDHDLWLASGDVHTAHGDFLNAWEPEGLEREVLACIHRDVVCNLASSRGRAPFFHD